MRHVLPVCERRSFDRGRHTAHRRGNVVIDRGVGPRGGEDRREDRMGAVRRPCGPGPVGEDTAGERLEG